MSWQTVRRHTITKHPPRGGYALASGHTFGKVFRILDGTVFEQCFRRWVASIVGIAEGVVAFDGKTLRGSKDGPNTALHMVSAYATALDVWPEASA